MHCPEIWPLWPPAVAVGWPDEFVPRQIGLHAIGRARVPGPILERVPRRWAKAGDVDLLDDGCGRRIHQAIDIATETKSENSHGGGRMAP